MEKSNFFCNAPIQFLEYKKYFVKLFLGKDFCPGSEIDPEKKLK